MNHGRYKLFSSTKMSNTGLTESQYYDSQYNDFVRNSYMRQRWNIIVTLSYESWRLGAV